MQTTTTNIHFNIRSVRHEGKPRKLSHLSNTYNQSIVGIVYQKLVHTNVETKALYLDESILITSSAWRNSRGAACGGVGILLSKNVENHIAKLYHSTKEFSLPILMEIQRQQLSFNIRQPKEVQLAKNTTRI